jgi:phosphopentomutase
MTEAKKLTPVNRETLLEEIKEFGFSNALTVGDIKLIMQSKGIEDKYTWKQNTKGYFSAWS